MATPRKQTLGQSQVLFTSAPGIPVTGAMPSSGAREIYAVTSWNSAFNYDTQPISVLGQLSPIAREATTDPTVEFNFDYYLTNFDNEYRFGLVTNGTSGAFSKIINGSEDEKNYYILVAAEGTDGVGGAPASSPCIGFGNGALASYSVNFAVGDYPTASVSFNALNAVAYADSVSETIPAIDPNTGLQVVGALFTLPTASGQAGYNRDAVIRPRDILVDLSGVSGIFYNIGQSCVTSATISLDLGREPLECLGARYSKARNINYPVDVTLEVVIRAPDIVAGKLDSYFCPTGQYNATVTCRRPGCPGFTGENAFKYDLRGLTFVSQSESVAPGTAGKDVTLNFVTSLGAANDQTKNLFMSGMYNP